MNEIFLVGAVIAFAGAALALLLVRGGDMHREADPVPAAAEPAPV
jgi:hypothetical protein